MGMVFCRGCGKEIHESAPACPQCGAPQRIKNTPSDIIPDGIRGWSWGAFLLNWIWAIFNKTWIGLLVLVPFVGFVMVVVLGFKGREWAWENNHWDSVEHFNRVQKKWSFWGVMIIVVPLVIGILAAIAIPAYQSYQHRVQEVAAAKNSENTSQSQQTMITPQLAQPRHAQATPIIGTWEWTLDDGSSKRMNIQPASTEFDVFLFVSTAPLNPAGKWCNGSIETHGILSGNTLNLTNKDGKDACTIAVKFLEKTAEVDEQNCSERHGAACDFSGTLERIE